MMKQIPRKGKRIARTVLCMLALGLSMLINICSAHAESGDLYAVEGEELVLFDIDGIKMYLTGENEIVGTKGNGEVHLQLPVVVENNTDSPLSIQYTGTVNGWSISNCFIGGNSPQPNSKAKCFLWFNTEDIGIESYADLEEMNLIFTVENMDTWDKIIDAFPIETVHFNEAPPADIEANNDKNIFGFNGNDYSIQMPVYEIVEYGTNDFDSESCDFVYNEKGFLIEKTDRGNGFPGTYRYEYDDQGRVITQDYLYANSDFDTCSYTYYDNGLISTKTENMEKQSTFEYEYNENGQPVKQTITCGDDEYIYSFEYDEQGNITTEKYKRYSEGIEKSSFTDYYSYDAMGNMIRMEMHNDESGNTNAILMKFDMVDEREISPKTNPEMATADHWISFDEVSGLPMPNSCITTMEFMEKADNDDAIIYTYRLPGSKNTTNGTYQKYRQQLISFGIGQTFAIPEKAQEYQMYQLLLSQVCGFDVEFDDAGIVYISKNGELLSAMMAGTEEDGSQFVQISFPK